MKNVKKKRLGRTDQPSFFSTSEFKCLPLEIDKNNFADSHVHFNYEDKKMKC